MTRGARRIGFALSAIVHVAAAALLVLPGTTPVESTPQRVVPIDLEMFASVVRRAVGQHDATATIAHAAPPPSRRVTRAAVVEPVAEPAVDRPLPVATESRGLRAVATANPVSSPSPVVTPTLRRAAERPHPREHAVERAPPVAVPIDHAAQRPAPRQRPRVAKAGPAASPPARPLPRAVERASRTPGAAAPPVTHDVAQTTATSPPVPAIAEAGTAARPAAPAAVTHSRPPPTDSDAVRRAYLAALAEAIDRNKYYPRKSRRRAEQGRVTVAFVIAADGTISDVAVASSSGYRRLDAAARDAVRRLVRFQPIPEALARDRWPIRVPLDFRLR